MDAGESHTLRAGRLLVATPALADPDFARTVVLLLDLAEDGALGVVLNRPLEVPVVDVLETWAPVVAGPRVLFQGGPVELESALAVARVPAAQEPPGWRRLFGDTGLVDLDTPPELLSGALASLRIFAGYAGWGSEQLRAEVEEGSWYVVDGEPRDAFLDSPDDLWRQVLRRQGGELAMVSTYPADPTRN